MQLMGHCIQIKVDGAPPPSCATSESVGSPGPQTQSRISCRFQGSLLRCGCPGGSPRPSPHRADPATARRRPAHEAPLRRWPPILPWCGHGAAPAGCDGQRPRRCVDVGESHTSTFDPGDRCLSVHGSMIHVASGAHVASNCAALDAVTASPNRRTRSRILCRSEKFSAPGSAQGLLSWLNMSLPLAVTSGTGWMTSQCSMIFPSSLKRKMSTAAAFQPLKCEWIATRSPSAMTR
jgi:hypothetical protein